MLAQKSYDVLTGKELSSKLVEGGLETAQKFTWEKVVDRFEQAFKE